MKRFNAVLLCVAIAVCAYSSSDGPVSVSAQPSAYSDASLDGTYAFSVLGDWTLGQAFNGIGKVLFDGSGNITGGSITELVFTSGPTCTGTLSGTYALSQSGSGTAQITTTLLQPCDQAWQGPVSFNIEVSQGGASALIASVAPAPAFTGTLLKQDRRESPR